MSRSQCTLAGNIPAIKMKMTPRVLGKRPFYRKKERTLRKLVNSLDDQQRDLGEYKRHLEAQLRDRCNDIIRQLRDGQMFEVVFCFFFNDILSMEILIL